jgi:hypothetical protein
VVGVQEELEQQAVVVEVLLRHHAVAQQHRLVRLEEPVQGQDLLLLLLLGACPGRPLGGMVHDLAQYVKVVVRVGLLARWQDLEGLRRGRP